MQTDLHVVTGTCARTIRLYVPLCDHVRVTYNIVQLLYGVRAAQRAWAAQRNFALCLKGSAEFEFKSLKVVKSTAFLRINLKR